MLKAHALEKAFGPKKVVEDLSFELRPGEILGLLGPNGAGKTTTVGMLYGQTLPCSGSVSIQGVSVHKHPTTARKRIGIVLQEACLDPDFSVFGNLCIYALYHGIKRKMAQERARELIAEFQLEEYKDSVIETLSGGLQRRVSLARALMHDPELLFLDEPTVGLDPDIRQQFWRYISALRAAGKGILLTTHYMEEAERLSDRVLLLDRGRLIGQGSPSDFTPDKAAVISACPLSDQVV